ncbi:MAG: dephospho-CoA kinase [Piscinibacter sp.]
MPRSHPLRIGLTGGIGSGKSTVAAQLAGLGAVIVDTDAIARSLTLPGGAALDAIAAQFGPEYIDAGGALDRTRMRSLAFADASARQRLEAILHPLIRVETARQAKTAGACDAIVFDVPLLVESGRWREQVDRVLVVDCSEDTQVRRVVARSGWSEEAVRTVIAQQANRAARRASADAVVFNDEIDAQELSQQLRALWSRWCTAL